MTVKQAWNLIKNAGTSFVDDYAQSMGAALAYYTMFSIAPLLLIVISVAGLIFGVDAARGEIFEQLRGMMGEEGALALQILLESVAKPAESVLATIVGIVILLIGATTVFAELQSSLDRIWRAPARKEISGIWSLLRARLLSFGLILGIGFLLMVSLVFDAAMAALGRWWAPMFGGWQTLAHWVNILISFMLTVFAFAMIYKVMPRVNIAWQDVTVGAIVTALLFTFGKFLIGLYIGTSGITSSFGAAGSLVVVLIWVYYSAQTFLMGAEFTWAYSHTFGSRRNRVVEKADETDPVRRDKAIDCVDV